MRSRTGEVLSVSEPILVTDGHLTALDPPPGIRVDLDESATRFLVDL